MHSGAGPSKGKAQLSVEARHLCPLSETRRRAGYTARVNVITKVTVVRLGHVGIVAASGLARSGHEVLATDVDSFRVQALGAGECGRFEPGLRDRLKDTLKAGNIKFTHCDEVDGNLGGVALVAVGTPASDGYAPDLGQVRAAIRWVKERSDGNLVMAMKSTVPPGTGHAILQDELPGTGIGYAANPEFLRAGQALADWDCPDRVIIGTEPGDTLSLEVVRRLYNNINAPVLATDITTAEMIKYASNAFLATRISFVNEIAAICDSVGASIDNVSEGLALGSRSGARIFAGVGYGGPCLPKDVGALDHLARTTGVGFRPAPCRHRRQRAPVATSAPCPPRPVWWQPARSENRSPRPLLQARNRRPDRSPGGETGPLPF